MIRTIPVIFEEDPLFDVVFESDPRFDVVFEQLNVVGVDVEIYTGDTVVIPSDGVQILSTSNKKLTSDIQIQPIPSNYGKISWDGFRLMIT